MTGLAATAHRPLTGKVRAGDVIVSSSSCQRWPEASGHNEFFYFIVFPVVSSCSSGGSEEESAVQTPSVLHPSPHQLQEVCSPEKKHILPNSMFYLTPTPPTPRPVVPAGSRSPQEFLQALVPQLRPLSVQVEVFWDQALAAGVELVRRPDFDPTHTLSVR